jgi:hypothetical protein
MTEGLWFGSAGELAAAEVDYFGPVARKRARPLVTRAGRAASHNRSAGRAPRLPRAAAEQEGANRAGHRWIGS